MTRFAREPGLTAASTLADAHRPPFMGRSSFELDASPRGSLWTLGLQSINGSWVQVVGLDCEVV